MERTPDIREWRLLHAEQERERRLIATVLRDFERRTPRRPEHRSSPTAPATASGVPTLRPTSGPSAAAAAALPDRPQASISPRLSRRRPLAESWRDGGNDHRVSPRPSGFAPADGLSWRGERSSSTAMTGSSSRQGGAAGLRASFSGFGSPIDFRSAGRGVLGLSSLSVGMLREEERDSPPRPRAFWREPWLGDGDKDQSLRRCPDVGFLPATGDRGSNVGFTAAAAPLPPPAPPPPADPPGAPAVPTAAAAEEEPRGFPNGDGRARKGWQRCSSGGSMRDSAAAPSGRREQVAGEPGGRELEQELERNRFVDSDREGAVFAGGSGWGGGGGAGGGGGVSVSAAGFALLTVVAVAAFGAGSLVSPSPRQRSVIPSASPREYASPRPTDPSSEPPVFEMRAREKELRLAKRGVSVPPRDDGLQETSGVREGIGSAGEDAGALSVAAVAASARPGASLSAGKADGESVKGSESMPDDLVSSDLAEDPASVDIGCNGPVDLVCGNSPSSDAVGDSPTPPPARCRGSALFAQAQELTVVCQPLVGGVDGEEAGPCSSSSAAGDAPPSCTWRGNEPDPRKLLQDALDKWANRASLLARDASASRKRPRAVASPNPASRRSHVSSASLDAFAQKLAEAERSLMMFSRGWDDHAESDAWRVEMSRKAARDACSAMASSSFSVAGNCNRVPKGGDVVCDKGAAWRNRKGQIANAPFPFFTSGRGHPSILHYGKERTTRRIHGAKGDAAINRDETRAGKDQKLDIKDTARGADELGGGGRGPTIPPNSDNRDAPSDDTPFAPDGRGAGGAETAVVACCDRLVLSGNDFPSQWVGRYTLILADGDPRRYVEAAPATSPSPSPSASIKTPYYCLEPPPAPAGASVRKAEGDPSRSEARSFARDVGPQFDFGDASVLLGLDEIGDESPDGGLFDGVEALAPGEAGSSGAAEVLPAARSPDDGAVWSPVAGNELFGVLDTASAEDSEEDGPICVYWVDVDGGRWVVDDDLLVSTGVLAVTSGQAPAAAPVAFSNHRGTRQFEARGVGNGWEGGSGGGSGGGGRDEAELSKSSWLLDSPRLLDWVAAEDVVVACATDD